MDKSKQSTNVPATKEIKKDVVNEIKETVSLEKPQVQGQGKNQSANRVDSMPKATEMYHTVAAKGCALVGDKEGEARHEVLADVKRNSRTYHLSHNSSSNSLEPKEIKKDIISEIKETVPLEKPKAQGEGRQYNASDEESSMLYGETYHNVAAKACALVGDKEGEGRHEAMAEVKRNSARLSASFTHDSSSSNVVETKQMKKSVVSEIKNTVPEEKPKSVAQGQNTNISNSSAIPAKAEEIYHKVAAKTASVMGDKEAEGRHEVLLEAKEKNKLQAAETLEKSKQQAINTNLQGGTKATGQQKGPDPTVDSWSKSAQGLYEGIKEFFTGEGNDSSSTTEQKKSSDIPETESQLRAHRDLAQGARAAGDGDKAAVHDNKVRAKEIKENTKENLENIQANVQSGVNKVKNAFSSSDDPSASKNKTKTTTGAANEPFSSTQLHH